jgi:hypothetical protein
MKRKAPKRRNPSTVADAIAKQLGGTGRLQSMVGAKNMAYDADSFQFKFQGSPVANYVVIKLLPSDEYKVTFYKIRGLNAPIVKEVSGVDASQLRDLFEQTTKLYLSLGTMRANGAKSKLRRNPAGKLLGSYGNYEPYQTEDKARPYLIFDKTIGQSCWTGKLKSGALSAIGTLQSSDRRAKRTFAEDQAEREQKADRQERDTESRKGLVQGAVVEGVQLRVKPNPKKRNRRNPRRLTIDTLKKKAIKQSKKPL